MKLLAALVIALSLPIAARAAAQTVPFGKNKIQYMDFEWRVLSGEHIDVYYYPEEEDVARLALSYGEQSYSVLERRFQHHPFRRIPLIVYSSDQHFEQTNVFPGFIPEGVLGFTEYLKRRVALPFRGDYDQFRNTLRHELVHAFQISKISESAVQHPRVRRAPPQQVHWWTEGLAEFWSSEQTNEDEMFIRDLVVRGRIPDIERFTYTYSYMSYPLGAELHKYLNQRFGDEYVVRVYEDYWKYDSFLKTLEGVLGIDLDQLSREFRYSLEQRFFPAYAERPPLAIGAREVIAEGGANVKPVSYRLPNDTTTRLLYLSAHTGYTTLYGASLSRGESSAEKILEGERSAEFESFHAYESSYDINGSGIVALVTKYLERDALVLWDLGKRETVGRYQWPDLVGVKSPAWDRAGKRVVFEGLSTAGFSDLYVIDFDTQRRSALTADRYADRDPDWSPDGSTVVFSSDRTRFGDQGFTNLYAVDVRSRAIRALTQGRWHDQQPNWSNAGDRIAFTSDRAGTYDLHSIDGNGTGSRITYLTGGVFDPDWLPDDRGLVFAGFDEGSFRIYHHPLAIESANSPIIALAIDTVAGHWQWELTDAVDRPAPQTSTYSALDKITLDVASGDAVFAPGLGTAQGAQFLLTDMLGDHILFAGVAAVQADQLSDLVDNFSGNLFYLNLARRLNYGVGLFRFEGRFRDVTFDIYDEKTVGGYFLASYPFSKFNRVELQVAVERSNRDDIADIFEDHFTGNGESSNLTRSGTLASNYLSYVKDNTLWLPTGPIDGERFNVTAGLVSCFACSYPSQVTGLLVDRAAAVDNFVVYGDYRRYLRTTQYSAYALRAYLFYSSGTLPARSVLGGPHQLRGYPRFSMAGSRVWLLSQEWRFPILQSLSLTFPFGELRLPGIQGAFFADAGSSWLDTQSKPRGTWGSYGMGFRTSLGAPFVLRMDVGRRYRIGAPPPVLFSGREQFNDTFVDFFFGFNY
ncbi:MAG: hypothetical protein WEE89_01180 [Gemmatimonadota bacterium]